MTKKYLFFIFFYAHAAYSESYVYKQAEKIYQDCLKENEAETCTSGCGMILHSCEELKDDYLEQHGIKKEQDTINNPPASTSSSTSNPGTEECFEHCKPKLEAVVTNMGPGCRIKIYFPVGRSGSSNYTGYMDQGKINPSWTNGSISFHLDHAPYWNDDWFVGFTCYSADADTVPPKNDTVAFDNKKQRWIRNPANTDIIPEQHLKVYTVKTPNALGWAYTDDDTAVEHPERRMQYCVYHSQQAVCGETPVGAIETIRRHPHADRTPYVLKILNSIEFLEDAPPSTGNAGVHP